jgi:flagellin-specific chaperone FliS
MATINTRDAADCYLTMQIKTASKSKAIYMLHDRCIYFLLKSKIAPLEKSSLLRKAQNILSQLQMSLKVNDSVSSSLFYLYDYCYVCLERGYDQDRANALEILRMLQQTFRELLKKP